MFYETAAGYAQPLASFAPYPDITDRTAWNSLDAEWKKETVKLGEKYLHFSYPALSATDFMDFTRTGNRTRYEEKFFSKRHALDALVLAECVEDGGRFLDDIVNGIFSICEESAWQLPPHNSYIRDTPQLPLPDADAPVLDLFACETGAVLSTVYYLLKSRLDEISPFIGKRIASELQRRIFAPYLNCHFWWMGNGAEPMNNWTIWCTQNVLLSVFLLNTDEPFRRSVFEKAAKSTDYFLAEYGEDGCCDEGAQYYRHAGLCLFNVMELLNKITNGAFSSFYQNARIQNIASYILNVHIEDKYYVNFADCSPVAGRSGVREFLFAKRTANEDMAAYAAADFTAGLPETMLLPSENNLFYRLQNAFTIQEIRAYAQSMQQGAHGQDELSRQLIKSFQIKHPDIYYPSVGIFIARDDSLCLAVKAGDNADSHNHNDTGSFTVYKNAAPMFIDIGVESYTKKTFSPQRYEIWTMQSAYHNLPTINGYMQKDGAQYCASDVAWQLSDSVCNIHMDIASAYPAEAGLLSYQRSASLIKGKEIVIKDRFAFRDAAGAASVLLSFLTYEKPLLQEEADALAFAIGALGTLRISGVKFSRIETIPITDARLKTAWSHEIYRILVAAVQTEIEIHIS